MRMSLMTSYWLGILLGSQAEFRVPHPQQW
jgi:hypothetical protein